ncbi:hypothetical protein K7432_015161 [Basidiobolus ranarum]|uniref:START domain-containing protein n=1 Tax=Basidiobolus ranarum TaxID=34480 RepID=A0ABR2WGJ5_9FUNG
MMANHVTSKAIYTFGFSTDEEDQLPNSNSCVRAQLDIAGWHFEEIGVNHVRVTYIVQMDPKGWIPSSLLNLLTTNIPLNIADVVDYLEMHGAPPNVLSYDNCSIIEADYNHRKNLYTLRYKVFTNKSNSREASVQKHSSMIIRLDHTKWSNGGNAVVEMEANSIVEHFTSFVCFKSTNDSTGMRFEIQHKPNNLLEEDLLVTIKIRKASVGNGFKINGYRMAVWSSRDEALASESHSPKLHVSGSQIKGSKEGEQGERSSPDMTRSNSISHSRSEVLKSSSSSSISGSMCDLNNTPPLLSPKDLARSSVELLKRLQSEPDENWALISSSTKTGLSVSKQYISELSSSMPTLRGVKVIEGFAPEDIAAVICSPGCRQTWDDTFDTGMVLEVLDNGFTIAHQFVKGLFPLKARDLVTITCTYASASPTSTIYFSSTSVPFSPNIINTHVRANLPLYGWTCELVDPYQTSTNYPIPSTRVSIYALLDLGGSVPSSLSNMVTPKLPKHILNVENYLKNNGPPPYPILPKQHTELLPNATDEGNPSGRERKMNLVEINGKAVPSSELHHFELSNSVVLNSSFDDSSHQYQISTMFQLADLPEEVDGRGSSSSDLLELQMEFVVILDLVIDLNRYPGGYEIQANVSPGVPFVAAYNSLNVPVAVYVVDIPPAPSYSTSLKSSSKHNKHLIRVVQYVCKNNSFGSEVEFSGYNDIASTANANWILNFNIDSISKVEKDGEDDEWSGSVLINKHPIQVIKNNGDKLETSEIVKSLYKIKSNGISDFLEDIVDNSTFEPIRGYSEEVEELEDAFPESIPNGKSFNSVSTMDQWAMSFNRLRPRQGSIGKRNSLMLNNRQRWMHTVSNTKTPLLTEQIPAFSLIQVVGLGLICFILGICIRLLAIDPWCSANFGGTLDGRDAIVLFSSWFGWDVVLVRR